jgi:septum formation inhibitor MinC
MSHLKFLVMFNNQITEVTDELATCTSLEVLDLSNNQITSVDIQSLPTSLLVLNLKGNPICNDSRIMDSLLQQLPKLIELNDVTITKEMRENGVFISTEQDEEEEAEDTSESFESFTMDKLRQSSNSFLQSPRPLSARDTTLADQSSAAIDSIESVRSSFQRDLEDPYDHEEKRQHNLTIYQELLLKSKQIQSERQQVLINDLEQLRHNFKQRKDKVIEESRKRRQQKKQEHQDQQRTDDTSSQKSGTADE